MASQYVPLAVCGYVFMIRFTERVIEGGRMSDGYTPRNEGTSFSVQSICAGDRPTFIEQCEMVEIQMTEIEIVGI